MRILAIILAGPRLAAGQTVEPPYDATYTITDLGSAPGVPANYGGLTFKIGDPDTILIGGAAAGGGGTLYAIAVTRDGSHHISGFSGTASVAADAIFNDGGVAYGPGGVLFLTRYPLNQLGETKPGSSTTDKIIDLGTAPLDVTPSPGGLNFVPSGYPGAGQLKIVSYNTGNWYTLALAPDGSGTYDVTAATLGPTIGGNPEGFVYVPPGSPGFTDFQSILVSEYGAGVVSTYTIDANGDPVVASRAQFVTGLTGAEGAEIDPVTGDFLFSTFGGTNHVIAVHGFAPTTTTTTTTTTITVTTVTTTTSTTITVTTTTSTTTSMTTASSPSTTTSTAHPASTTTAAPLPLSTTTTTLPACGMALPLDSLGALMCAISTLRDTLDAGPLPLCTARCRCNVLGSLLDRVAKVVAEAQGASPRKCRRRLGAARRTAKTLGTRVNSLNKRTCLAPAARGSALAQEASELSTRMTALFQSDFCHTM